MIISILSYLFISLGLVILFTASIALVRFPDIYMRLHASSKASTGGTITILIGLLLHGVSLDEAGKMLLVISLVVITSPITSHAIARAAHKCDDIECQAPFEDMEKRGEQP